MEIVCFEQKYEEELIELWNQTMIFDPVSADKFRTQVLLDENFDRELCLLARTKDRVVGFILGIKRRFPYLERGLEPDRGWISLMFVAIEFRRRGIGTRQKNLHYSPGHEHGYHADGNSSFLVHAGSADRIIYE